MIPIYKPWFQWGRSEVIIIYPDIWENNPVMFQSPPTVDQDSLEENSCFDYVWPGIEVILPPKMANTCDKTL